MLTPLRRLPFLACLLVLAACGNGGGDATVDMARLMEAGPLGDQSLGDPDAPVTVIEYASMTCSHCRAFEQTVFDRFIADYVDSGRVRFIFREFPLDPVATAAAALARCAPGDNGFFGMVDLLFETQPTWINADDRAAALLTLATQAGFTQESFEACLANQDILDGIAWNYERGTELGVNATPTFFVNGEKHTGELTLEQLGALVVAAE